MIELVIRVVVSLALVLGLLWLVARASSRRFGGTARSMVRVVARQSLARNSALAVVEVGERVLVVGVGEHGVSLLTELDPDEVPDVETTRPPGSGRDAGFRLVRGTAGPDRAVAARVAAAVAPVAAHMAAPVAASVGSSTRTASVAPGAHAAPRPAGLAGSVLSAGTWKQAWAAATSRNGAGGD